MELGFEKAMLPGYVACRNCDHFLGRRVNTITCQNGENGIVNVRIIYNPIAPGGATFLRGTGFSECPEGRLKN
jgi:hypothetical protein